MSRVAGYICFDMILVIWIVIVNIAFYWMLFERYHHLLLTLFDLVIR